MARVPEWKKNLYIICFTQLAGMGAIIGVIAFLPLFVPFLGVTSLEEAELWSGLLLSSAPLFAAFSGPQWGALADRKGRKPMVERAMLCVGLLILAMAFVTNVYQLLVLRIAQGILGGFSAAALALVTSVAPEEEMGYSLGLFQTSQIAGGTLVPLLCGLVADHIGYREAFVALSLLCFISLFAIRFFVTEHFTPQPRARRSSFISNVRDIIHIPGLKTMLILQFLIQFAIQAIVPVLPLHIKGLSPDSSYVATICGAIVAVVGLTSALSSTMIGRISRRYSHSTILKFSTILAALFFVAQALSRSIPALLATRGISGLFIGTMAPSSNAIIAMLIPAEKRGIAYGVTSSASLIGNMMAPLAGGALALYYGSGSVFWCIAAVYALTAVWVTCFVREPAPLEPEQTGQQPGQAGA